MGKKKLAATWAGYHGGIFLNVNDVITGYPMTPMSKVALATVPERNLEAGTQSHGQVLKPKNDFLGGTPVSRRKEEGSATALLSVSGW
jgi:hypothetical protein